MSLSAWLDELEWRAKPNAADIDAAIKKVMAMPGAGDQAHVAAVFKLAETTIPDTPDGAWDDADVKMIKFKKMRATNAQLDRKNLIWHLKHPNQSKMKTEHNTHPQIIKKDGECLIVDGHHRLSALLLLGLDREQCWLLNAKDM